MAEKQFALGGTRSASYLEEDDPLAELARIVGFQAEPVLPAEAAVSSSRPDPVLSEFPAGAVAPAPAASNPVADLEDELLRAFETYEAPRAEPEAMLAPIALQTVSIPAVAADVPVAVSAPDEDDDPFGALAAIVASSVGR